MRRFVVLPCFALLCAAIPDARAHPVFTSRQIVNAASFMPAEVHGGDIARGAIFTIFGSAIGPANAVQAESFPLQPTLGRVMVTVSQRGSLPVRALPLFVSEGQINAIMPSNAPLGAVEIEVEFNDGDGSPGSIPVPAQVVEASFGIFTATGRGVGPSIAFNFEAEDNQPLNATTRSARPGQAMVLWGTGLGATTGGDDRPPGEVGGVIDVKARAQVEVWVGGARAESVLYAGRSPGFAGLDQINFIVPEAAARGCYSPIWVKVTGARVSNVGTLAIANEAGACSDPVNPYLGPGVGPRVGLVLPQRFRFEAGASAANIDTASASFQELTLRDYFFNPALSLPPRGSCLVFHPSSLDPEGLPNERPTAPLEAGAAMALHGPSGARELTRTASGFYETLLEGGYLSPGSYTLESAGGAGVAAFQQTFAVGDPPTFRLPGDGVTVRRGLPLMVEWTGGDPQAGLVRILGVVSSSALASARVRATFVCTVTPEQGFFEIPGDILSNLPVSVGSGAASTAQLYVGVTPLPETSQFHADGLDFGATVPIVMRGKAIRVQ